MLFCISLKNWTILFYQSWYIQEGILNVPQCLKNVISGPQVMEEILVLWNKDTIEDIVLVWCKGKFLDDEQLENAQNVGSDVMNYVKGGPIPACQLEAVLSAMSENIKYLRHHHHEVGKDAVEASYMFTGEENPELYGTLPSERK